MAGKARTGDLISHGGTVTGSQTKITANGLSLCVVGDSAQCSQHGAQTIVSGSGATILNGKLSARTGDTISCGATITGGSTTVGIGLPNKPSSNATTFVIGLSSMVTTSDNVSIT